MKLTEVFEETGNFISALKYYDISCSLEEAWGCYKLGAFHEEYLELKLNPAVTHNDIRNLY